MKNVFILGTALLLLAGLFTVACKSTGEETLPFNAKGIGLPLAYKEDFLKTNTTGGMWGRDKTSPEFITYIITEKARLDEVFSVCPEIDFEKEMVVMYAFTAIYARALKITSVTLDNQKLKIKFKYVEGNGSNDASAPQTRFLVLRMDKLNIDTVEFTLLNPRG
jgi:hypothetical protein